MFKIHVLHSWWNPAMQHLFYTGSTSKSGPNYFRSKCFTIFK